MTDGYAFRWRVISPWVEPDGMVFFSAWGNAFTWREMLDPESSSAWGRWVADVRQWGFNGMEVIANPDQHPQEMRAFASYLKANGIGLIFRRHWNEVELGYSWPLKVIEHAHPSRRSRALCPYSDATRAWWQQRIARDFAAIPDLAGYRMSGTEAYSINGAPWMCDCPVCRAQTPRVRVRDAMRLVADLLKPYGGTLFYQMHQDDPESCRKETFYFTDLASELPDNAFVDAQNTYWDFHPGWPRHPLLERLGPDGRSGAAYMTNFQVPGEYRGANDFPWCLVDEWSAYFRQMAVTGQRGVWLDVQGMRADSPGNWDHPLNMVNWYAIARLMRDPGADPAEIKLTWAEDEFGREAAPVVLTVLDRVTEAARGALEFDALWTACHSRFPSLDYLDSHLCGPYRRVLRMEGLMGFVLPLDMYPPQRAADIRANPATRLVFNQVPITPTLKAEAMAQKEGAVRRMEEAIALWRSLNGKIDPGRHQNILVGLEGNRDDALIFRHMMDLYMDWKLGVLTETKIDAALAASRGRRGILVPDPLSETPQKFPGFDPASLKTFAEQLRRELNEPWIEKFWQDNPIGVGTLEPESDETVEKPPTIAGP